MASKHSHPSMKAMLLAFVALMLLLGVTVGVAYLPLGNWAPVVAMAVAGVKAALVGLIFMQLRYRDKLISVFAAGGLLWLAILFLLTFADYATRGNGL